MPCSEERAALLGAPPTEPAEPHCNHDDAACHVESMTVCECGAVYDEGWIGERDTEQTVWNVLHGFDDSDGPFVTSFGERAAAELLREQLGRQGETCRISTNLILTGDDATERIAEESRHG